MAGNAAQVDSAVADFQPSVSVSNRNPCSSRGPSVSWRSWCARSGIATRCERRRSHQTRSAACWAMVPLTKKTAAGFPSSSATSASSRSTAPLSPYRSHSSIPSSSAASASSLIVSAGPRCACQTTVSSHASSRGPEPFLELVHSTDATRPGPVAARCKVVASAAGDPRRTTHRTRRDRDNEETR